MPDAAPDPSGRHRIMAALLAVSDAIAAIMLAADLLVVCGSVLLRYLFNAPVEWSDDVARGLMVGSSFFGAASAVARAENLGVAFFVNRLPAKTRRVVDAVGGVLVVVIACAAPVGIAIAIDEAVNKLLPTRGKPVANMW